MHTHALAYNNHNVCVHNRRSLRTISAGKCLEEDGC